jgi:hypothetical protein
MYHGSKQTVHENVNEAGHFEQNGPPGQLLRMMQVCHTTFHSSFLCALSVFIGEQSTIGDFDNSSNPPAAYRLRRTFGNYMIIIYLRGRASEGRGLHRGPRRPEDVCLAGPLKPALATGQMCHIRVIKSRNLD